MSEPQGQGPPQPQPPSGPGPAIDALVRAYLERQAETVDARAMLEGIRQRLAQPGREAAGGVVARRVWRRIGWAMAGAAVVLAFLGGRYLAPASASTERLLRGAQRVHALPLDRCYYVEWQLEPGVVERGLVATQPGSTRLWTRGDRFWIESIRRDRRVAYGRDEQRRVWVARSRSEGVRYEADEAKVPAWLARTCDLYSMRVETLLSEVLSDFDLSRRTTTDASGLPLYVLEARPKAGFAHPSLSAARLELDAETNVLRRVVLWRHLGGKPVATVTHTLVATGYQDDDQYLLEGHLDTGAAVYSKSFRPAVRQAKVSGLFGRATAPTAAESAAGGDPKSGDH
jgi:hypothetical protein